MQVWLSASEGARRCHVARHTFKKIAKAAGVRTRVLPGMAPRLVQFLEEDLDRVLSESIIDPGQAGEAVAS